MYFHAERINAGGCGMIYSYGLIINVDTHIIITQ